MKTLSLIKRSVVAAVAVVGLIHTSAAHADMVGVGAGIHSDLEGSTNLLLHVKVNKLTFKVNAELALGDAMDGSGVPYMDITFTPWGIGAGLDRSDLRLDFIRVNFNKNIALNQDTSMSISAVEMSYQAGTAAGDWTSLFFQLAVDAIGYKAKQYVETFETTYGFRLAGVELEAGLAAAITPGFSVVISAGAKADLNLATHSFGQIQSDLAVFTRVAFDFDDFVRIWAQLASVAGWDSEHSNWETAWLFTSGVTLHFN